MEASNNSWLWLTAIGILFSVFAKWLFDFCLTLYRLPPGPWGLPVLGYLPWLSNQVFKDFVLLGNKYGGLFSVRMGNELVVVLNDWPTVKAALIDQGKVFSGRKFGELTNVFSGGVNIAFSSGEVWLKQRNLAIRCLKNVGLRNKNNLEGRLMNMIHQLLEDFKKLDGQVINMEITMEEAIALGNWKLISGYEVVDTKEELESVKRDVATFVHAIRLDNPVGALPWLRFLPPNGFGFWAYTRAMDNYRKYLRKLIQKHYDQKDSGSDIIDFYIEEIKKYPDKQPPFNDDHLIGTVTDLITAAIETTFSAILWGLLHLSVNPEVQKKVREELDRVVGRNRLPALADFTNLPYLEAFIMENHRLGTVLPISIPHSTLSEVQINGYIIPKNTLCIQNIYALHHDVNFWEEQEVFRPERFIMKDGTVKAPPYLMPFSIGPRVCLGQFLAEIQLKLVFSCLLHQFTFCVPNDEPKPKLEAIAAFTRRPKQYSLQVKCRN